MNVKIPLFVLLVLAAALGYLMGTEAGQEQRDRLLEKLGRNQAEAEAAIAAAEQIIEDVTSD